MSMIRVRPRGGTDSDWQSFSPSTFNPSIQKVSAPSAGRTQDAIMHTNYVAEKQTIALSFNGPSPQETARILTAFDPENIDVEYTNPKTNQLIVKTFYSGDKSAPVAIWTVNNKRYSQVSFNIIEV